MQKQESQNCKEVAKDSNKHRTLVLGRRLSNQRWCFCGV